MTDQAFVTRERELSQIQILLDRALAGQGQVCFVTGEAGAGKTALVTEFARQAQEANGNLLAAIGICNAQTGIGDPYLPFREALRLFTGDVESGAISEENASRLSAFMRVSGQAVVEFGPDLIDIFVPGAGLVTRAATILAGRVGWLDRLEDLAERQSSAGDDTGLEQRHIFEQYTNVLEAMASQQPLVLALDDLQWADADSLNLLFHLGRRIQDSRILMVGTYRPDEVAFGRAGERHPLEPVVNELKRYYGDIWVTLDQEEASEGRRFVDALLDIEPNRLGDDFRQALFQRTKGHPLFTVELLRDMQERGDLIQDEGQWIEGPALDWSTLPARVEGVIEGRIGRLEQELREALTTASVEGEDFTAEVVAQVQAMDERGLIRRLSRELDRQHRLVTVQGTQRLGRQRLSLYRFRHNLFQSYLYDSLDAIERPFLHEDVGLMLEELYGDQADEIAVQLARHFEEAGLEDKARHYLYRAGARARRQFANTDALDYLDRALALTSEADAALHYAILLERERVYDVQGMREAQDQDLIALERLTEVLDDDTLRAQVALRRANFTEVTGDFSAAIAASQQAVELGERAGVLESVAAGYLQWGRALWRQADYSAASAKLEEALRLFHEVGDRQGEARTLNSLANVAADQIDYAGATAYYELALYHFREIGDRRGENMVLNNIGSVYQEQGDYVSAKAYYKQAQDISRAIGDREMEGYVFSNLGLIADYQGDYVNATSYYERALDIRRDIGDRRGEGQTLTSMGLLFHHRGDDTAARAYSQRAIFILQEVGDRRFQGHALTSLGHALTGLRQPDEAGHVYEQAVTLLEELSQYTAAVEPRAGLARISLAQGSLRQAQAQVEEILKHLEHNTSSRDSGHGLDGTDEPLRVYLTCYRVLHANQDPRAQEILATAHHVLQEQAAKITDEKLRQSFLENVPVHREIVEEWLKVSDPSPSG